ncbi:hypothetical protein B0H14DRAFT_3558461 [Mycena olivaceomarginata]|nr:hypothetical protein B0H14DRAFT_3558461 [Mycena olivaceomarginata]
MPPQPTVTQMRLNTIITRLTPAITLLKEANDVFGTPFVQAISNTTMSLITTVQNVKKRKDECVQLLENIHQLLYAIINLHIKSAGTMSPENLYEIARFTETLHKIHTFMEAQQDSNRIKHFLRQSEMNTLLKDCHEGLLQALDAFKIETGVNFFNSIAEMQDQTQELHEELLELISMVSDGTISDRSSSIYQRSDGSHSSSNSFAMLPARPQIFYGRDSELKDIVEILSQDSARIAILGGACDSATTSIEMATLLGAHIGLNPGKDVTKAVVQFFKKGPQSLLVLDNLETPWEPKVSRGSVEEFLSLLTDIPHLALMITMRGAERPARVCWSRPFLPPLKPLSDDAARQTFFDIAEDFHNRKDVDKLLQLTDNMPLAVDLIAHLVDYEGCANVLARWETERTSLLSCGHDRGSSLDLSIQISFSSPRIAEVLGAKELLSLLSVLPDGLSNTELRVMQSELPIKDFWQCKAVLLGTALAYNDDKKRFKSLVPIREYVQHFYPPSPHLIHPLRKHLHLLVNMYQKYYGTHGMSGQMEQLTSNLGNLQQLLMLGLDSSNSDLVDTLRCAISLNSFSRITGHGPLPCDHKLEVQYITEVLKSGIYHPVVNSALLISEGISHLHHFNDPALEYTAIGDFYNAVAQYYIGDYVIAQRYAREAQRLAQLSGNLYDEARAVRTEALCCADLGDYKSSIFLVHKTMRLLKLCGISGSSLEKTTMGAQAEVHLLKSEYVEARTIYTQSLQNISAEQDSHSYAFTLLNIAQTDMMMGADEHDVYQTLEEAKIIFRSNEFSGAVTDCEMILAELHLRERYFESAKSLFEKCLTSSWGKQNQTVTYCLKNLADFSRWSCTGLDWPSTWTVTYLGHAQKLQQKLELHKALQFLGDIFLVNGDEETAHNLFTVALEGFTQMDVHQSRAQCMLHLGDLAKERGDLLTAARLWAEARPLFERSVQAKDVSQIDIRLAAVAKDY